MVVSSIEPGGEVMRELTTIGIDLAKNVFAVHAVDRDGRVVLRRLVGRGKLAEVIAQLPPEPDWHGVLHGCA
jgi:hypothetical protein